MCPRTKFWDEESMSTSPGTLQSLKQFVPAPLKRAAKEVRSNRKLRRAIASLAKLPVGEMPTADMLIDLQNAWDNDGFAGRVDLLIEVVKRAALTEGPILECGSGLTTILMGLFAGRRGVRVYSLEHFDEWRARVLGGIEQFDIPNVDILSTPLRNFGGFEWYDVPFADLPANFSLLLCDGPPGETRGGRYGLLPVMRERLAPNAVIILDDTEREGELEVLRQWQSESSFDVTMHESANGSFAVLTQRPSPTGRRAGDEGLSVIKALTPTLSQRERELAGTQLPELQSSLQVSIVIPAYNVAPYIAETLDSVFAQTYTNYEVIVVNDGSPDTEEFEQAIAPYLSRIRYLKQENLGASVARNAGVKAAAGEFIAFLDADDLWQLNYLHEQLKFIRDRNSDLVCADAMMFGEPETEGRSYMTLLMNDAPSSDDVSFPQLIDASRCLITSGIVARRERLLDAGLFDPALRTAQDFDMWLRLALKGARVSYQRQALLKYRCRPDGLTRDTINSHQRELRVFDKIENSYDLSNINREQALKSVRDRRALLHFELGKLYAARGDFEKARDSFAESRRLKPALKKSVAAWLMRSAPRLMQSICARRV
jgi:glycosyltransferase involved in cell wall biosynthesis